MAGNDGSEHTKAGLIATALVAVLGLAAYWTMFYDMGFQSGQNERKANVEAEHYASDTANRIERECGAESGQSARECIAKIVAAERESQRGESDLAAQWKAANWVMWAGILAGAQLLATAFGLYFVKRTLDATLEAVEDTGNATKAMERQNELAEATAKRQLRAYVGPESADITLVIGSIPPEARLTIASKNTGQTPAHAMQIRVEYLFADRGWRDEWIIAQPESGHTVSVLFPACASELKNAVVSLGDYDRWVAGERDIFIFYEAHYRDVFGEPHRTTWRWVAKGDQPLVLIVEDIGNTAT